MPELLECGHRAYRFKAGRCVGCENKARYANDPMYAEKIKARARNSWAKRKERLSGQDLEDARAKRREYYRENSDRWVNSLLESKYGISLEIYENIYDAQAGKCAVCDTPAAAEKRMAVDHDHRTGKVRGLLCSKCNTGLGLFGDCSDRLRSAIRYLDIGGSQGSEGGAFRANPGWPSD